MKGLRPVCLAIAFIVWRAWTACAQDVALTDQGSTVTLANGYLTATITKSNAKVTSLIYQGHQMVNTSSNGYIYFSMDGGATYEQPSGCTYSVTTSTADMAVTVASTTVTSTASLLPAARDTAYCRQRTPRAIT